MVASTICRLRRQLPASAPNRLARAVSAALFLLALSSGDVYAFPTGAKVSAGSATVSGAGSSLTINQTSQNVAINWQSFDIAANDSVTFNQPNAGAIALNRVLGQNASHISGALSANGQVFILNPDGVLFGTSLSTVEEHAARLASRDGKGLKQVPFASNAQSAASSRRWPTWRRPRSEIAIGRVLAKVAC